MAETADDSQSLRAFTPALILLAICILINYVDRGNLSIAAPLLKDELGISASQLGILLAAFFWTYTAMQFVSGWLVDRFDVNLVIGVGLVSLLWLPAWMKWMPCGSAMGRSVVKTAAHIDILRQRSFWGASLGHFCGNYLLYFMVTWLPFYLVRERHLSMQSITMTASVYYLVDAVSAITSGRLSDFWIRKGYSTTLVRKTAMAIGFATAAIAMAACAERPHTYLPWLMAVGVGCGMYGAGIFAFSQTLAGPQAAGRWTGLQNGFANLAGVVAPALTGFAVDWTGNFVATMAITTGVLTVGAMAWVFVVGRVEQVNWAVMGEVYDGAPLC